MAFACAMLAEASSKAESISLMELRNALNGQGRMITNFHVEGVVCEVDHEQRRVVLQDETSTMLVALPALEAAVQRGMGLAIDGRECALTRGRFGVEVGTAPVVDLDGTHPNTRRLGRVYLGAGYNLFGWSGSIGFKGRHCG